MKEAERAGARECPNCGATVTSRDARFCEFCGYELPVRQDPAPPNTDPAAERRALFERLQASADYERLLAHRPRAAPLLVGPIIALVAVVVFLFVAMGMSGIFTAVGGPGLGLFPLVFVLFGIGMLAVIGRRVFEVVGSPLARVPARVLDERIDVSGGGRSSSASTRYFVTLEDAHGRRREYRTTGALAGRLVPGDVGVAFIRGRYLLDFLTPRR